MLFVPKWKSSVWHLPSNLFHSHRLHNASNFYSKLILNWISAWRSCSSGSLETEQDSLEPDWAAFQPFSPGVHLSPPDTVLETILGCLQHWSSPADTLQAEQKYMVCVFLRDHYSCPTSHNKVNTSTDPLHSHPLPHALSPPAVTGDALVVSLPTRISSLQEIYSSSYCWWLLMCLLGLN